MAYVRRQVFQPISFDEWLAPILKYKEEYDKLSEEYSKLQAGTERWKDEAENDPEVAARYKNYADALNSIVEDFSQGMTSKNNRGALLGLRKGYVENILPIETSYGIKSGLVKDQSDIRAKDNTAVFARDARDISLGEIMKDNHIGYGAYTLGSSVRKTAKEMAAPISKAFRTMKELDLRNLPNDHVLEQTYGITVGEMLDFQRGNTTGKVGEILNQILKDAVAPTEIYKSSELPDIDDDGNYEYSSDKETEARQRKSMELIEQLEDYARQGLYEAIGTSKFEFRHDPTTSTKGSSSGTKKESKPTMESPVTIGGAKEGEKYDSIMDDILPGVEEGTLTTNEAMYLDSQIDKLEQDLSNYTEEQKREYDAYSLKIADVPDDWIDNMTEEEKSNYKERSFIEKVWGRLTAPKGWKDYTEKNAQVINLRKRRDEVLKEAADAVEKYSHLVDDPSVEYEFLKEFAKKRSKLVDIRVNSILKSTQSKELARSIKQQMEEYKDKGSINGVYKINKDGTIGKEIKGNAFDKLFRKDNLENISFQYRFSDNLGTPPIIMKANGKSYFIKGSLGIDNEQVNLTSAAKFASDFSKESLEESPSTIQLSSNPSIEDLKRILDNNDISPLLEKAENLGRPGSGFKGITIKSENIPGKYAKLLFYNGKPILTNTVSDILNGGENFANFFRLYGDTILQGLYSANVGEAEEGRVG